MEFLSLYVILTLYNVFHFVCLLPQFGGKELRDEEQTAESIKNQMTVKEWEKVFEMSQDKNLYHNLCTSLFPTIHGKSSDKILTAFSENLGWLTEFATVYDPGCRGSSTFGF